MQLSPQAVLFGQLEWVAETLLTKAFL